jgi:glycosyltransferase involved in cell wall biosynthesis
MTNNKIAILIPCLNEEKTIEKVVTDFQAVLPNAEIYVCDNNSIDKTAELAKKSGAKVLKEFRKGKGNAVLKLFNTIDADIYVMVDGDDTYPASEVLKLISELEENEAHMVVGDRITNKSYQNNNKRKFHGFGNWLIKWLINTIFNSRLDDILSGYRVFNKAFVKNYSTLVKGFELETDLTLFSLNYNLIVKEVPIQYNDRPEGSISKLNTFSDGFKVIKTIFKLYRLYKPLSFFTLFSSVFFIVGCVLSSFPVYEYIEYRYVYKVPTAILAISLIIMSLLLFCCGLILDLITNIDKKNIKLQIDKYDKAQ